MIMLIKKGYMKNFEIKETDDIRTVLLKRYYQDSDMIQRKIEAEEKLNEFNDKYNDIKNMKRNSKTSIQELQLRSAIDELLGE